MKRKLIPWGKLQQQKDINFTKAQKAYSSVVIFCSSVVIFLQTSWVAILGSSVVVRLNERERGLTYGTRTGRVPRTLVMASNRQYSYSPTVPGWVGLDHECEAQAGNFSPREQTNMRKLRLSLPDLRWLDWIFWGWYLQTLSINHVGMSKDMEKRLPQLYYIKMKMSYDLGFIAVGVAMAT